jgi:hypothetical protein
VRAAAGRAALLRGAAARARTARACCEVAAIKSKSKTPFERPRRSARNDQIRGLYALWFVVHRRRRRREFFLFSARQELQSGQFGLRMAQAVHIKKPVLCVFANLFHCSGYMHKAPAMQYQQAEVFQTTRAGDRPVWLIWQVLWALCGQDEPQALFVSAGN